MKILFLGDSITDSRKSQDWEGLGFGYVRLVKEHFSDFLIINKGISGDRTNDLLLRLEEDVLKSDCEVLFSLVGVNDVWHHYAGFNQTSFNIVKNNYETILNEILLAKPNLKIVIMSPFAFQSKIFLKEWFNFLNEIIQLTKEISDKYKTFYLNLQEKFNRELDRYSEEELLYDGVHPTKLGHEIISNEVVKLIEKIKKLP